jgi:hypothetical protein
MVHKTKKKIIGTIDVLQEERKLKHPQIRVWAHPTKGGDDYYFVFKTIPSAYAFIARYKYEPKRLKKEVPETEPLIAYKGREMFIKDFIKQFPKVELKW